MGFGTTTGGVIDLEINDVINNADNNNSEYEYEVYLHTVNDDIKLEYVDTIENMRNYNSNLGDYLVVSFNYFGGEYIKNVHPYKDNLEMSIKKIYTNANTQEELKRYKFVIISGAGDIEGSNYTAMSRDKLNQTFHLRISGQCIERELEGLISVYTSGSYQELSVKNLMYATLYKTINSIAVEGQIPDIKISIVEPNQQRDINQIIIPTGIKGIEVPSYLQNTNIGVYNGGCGTYYQNYNSVKCLFVYPLYDTEAFDNRDGIKLRIYFPNTALLDTVENTYYQDGDVIKILANSNTKSVDTGANVLMDEGDTIYSSNSTSLLERNVTVSDDEIIYDQTSQLSGASIIDRDDGVKKGQYVGANSNLYKFRTSKLKKSLAMYNVQWHFSNPDLLYPGMPVQYIYEDSDNGIIMLNGTLQVVYTRHVTSNKSTSSLLSILVESPSAYIKNRSSS